METTVKNVFIVDDNLLWTTSLKRYLKENFGKRINISTFGDGESCVRKLAEKPDIILLDYDLGPTNQAKNGLDYLKEIKTISPKTEVFLVTATNDLKLFADSIFSGAKEFIVKDSGHSWTGVFSRIGRSINKILRKFVDYTIEEYIAIFLISFISMGIAVFITLKFFHN